MMNNRWILTIMAFGALVLAVSLACSTLAPTPTVTPEPTATPEPTPEAAPTDSASISSSGLITYTDVNNYLAIDVPAAWEHSQAVDSEKNYWYWDVLTAPDGHAKVESVVYDDGTAWKGSQNGRQALYMLHKFYSSTGEEGDIRVSGDSIMKDGSERLTWTSKGGRYSGESFFEVRNKTAFLMFTIWWDDDYASQYTDVLQGVVSSYRRP